jgi:hypothetical protein
MGVHEASHGESREAGEKSFHVETWRLLEDSQA